MDDLVDRLKSESLSLHSRLRTSNDALSSTALALERHASLATSAVQEVKQVVEGSGGGGGGIGFMELLFYLAVALAVTMLTVLTMKLLPHPR